MNTQTTAGRGGTRAARHRDQLQGLAAGSRPAHADEQPRPGGRGGAGRAHRLRRRRQGGPRLDSFDAIVPTLRRLKDDETLLVQSGKPVGVFETHEKAPRVLIANANLVGDWANWDEFRRLDALGLTMYGQMTAGSWIYIGTQGILQGTYQTFAAAGQKHYGADLAGKLVLRPASAAWAARSRSPSPWPAASRCASRSTRIASSAASRPATWTRRASLDEALSWRTRR